jgi:hypothetical protein
MMGELDLSWADSSFIEDEALRELWAFLGNSADEQTSTTPFQIMQANIYVTQYVARQLTLDYYVDLLHIQQAQLQAQHRDSLHTSFPSGGPAPWAFAPGLIAQEKDKIAADLLDFISSIPLQALAVNSIAVITKIRFVALSQLDILSGQTDVEVSSVESQREQDRVEKARSYLSE